MVLLVNVRGALGSKVGGSIVVVVVEVVGGLGIRLVGGSKAGAGVLALAPRFAAGIRFVVVGVGVVANVEGEMSSA